MVVELGLLSLSEDPTVTTVNNTLFESTRKRTFKFLSYYSFFPLRTPKLNLLKDGDKVVVVRREFADMQEKKGEFTL